MLGLASASLNETKHSLVVQASPLHCGMELTHYQRFLPHQLGAGESYFITFRLAGSLPREVVLRLAEERDLLLRQAGERPFASHNAGKRFFGAFDTALDLAGHGPCYLTCPAEAAIVRASLHFLDGPGYELLAIA